MWMRLASLENFLLHVPDDANHFGILRLRTVAQYHPDVFADRLLMGPEPAGCRLVQDCDGGFSVIGGLTHHKRPAAEHRNCTPICISGLSDRTKPSLRL